MSTQESPIDEKSVIRVEILPLVQMIKHTHSASPTNVSGQLLGRDENGDVDITYAYPMPIAESDIQEVDKAQFQENMIKCLHGINVDDNVVGWYTSTFLNSSFSQEMVISQYQYQLALGNNTVVLIIDSFQLSRGKLIVKGYRLTEQFMKLFADEKINLENIHNNKIDSSVVFEEVPLQLCVNEIDSAVLCQYCFGSLSNEESCLSNMNPTTFLEKNMEQSVLQMDSVIQERKDYPMQLKSSYKSQNEWVNREQADLGDSLLSSLDPEGVIYGQYISNNRLHAFTKYCSMKDFCHRLQSVSADDTKVLESINE